MRDVTPVMKPGLSRVHYMRLFLLLGLLLAGLIWLALDLRPSVSVDNQSDQPIIELNFSVTEGRQFSFSDVSANSVATLYHLPLPNDVVVRFSLRLADGNTALGRCGRLAANSWASRIVLLVDQLGAIRCEVR